MSHCACNCISQSSISAAWLYVTTATAPSITALPACYMLRLIDSCMLMPDTAGFSTETAVALSNLTILGGAAANFICNVRRRRPNGKPVIDWDLIMMMEVRGRVTCAE